MASDNTILSANVGTGDTVRDLADSSDVKWPVAVACYATTVSAGANVLQVVTPSAPLPVTAASLPLPTGAATAANQSTEVASLASIDGKVTACNTGAVVVSSSALPTGAATASNQATANASLASIDGKTPALGQALAAASVPVVLTAAQLSTLTPPSTVAATQSGTWTVAVAAAQTIAVTNAGTFAVQAAQSGSWAVTANAGTGTFAVSAASLPLPTGAATAAKQPALGTAGAASADVITVQGVASMTPLLATVTFASAQAVTQSGTWNITNISGTVSLPTNAAQETGGNLATLAGTVSAGKVAISGTVTANAGTNLNTSLLALESGGNLAAAKADLDTLAGIVSAGKASVFFASAQAVTQSGGPWTVTETPAASGGLTPYSYISAGSANQDSQAIKGSAGQVYGYSLFNTTASARYVKLYNKASGATSADTPVMRIYLPPSGGANMPQVGGIAFGTGICFRLTTGAADNDTGSCSANDVLANVYYK